MPKSPPPRRAIVIAARCIAIAIGLAGAEGLLWVEGYPSWWKTLHILRDDSEYAPDPVLGWKNREGRFDLLAPDRRVFHYSNWSHGRRATADHESASMSPAAQRVAFFGDSYVQGYGLSNEQTFAWMLQAAHPELAVSNFGTADYGTYQSYLAITANVRGPSSVFYVLNSFHEGRNVAEPDWVRTVTAPPPDLFFPYAELAGGTLRFEKSRGEMVWPVSRWLRIAALAEDYYSRLTSYPRMREKRGVTEALLQKMNDAVRATGGKFTVILFDMTPEQRRDYRAFVDSHGIRFIDCDHPEMADKRLRLPDGHPSEQLNRLLAQWIEPALTGSENAKL